MTVEALKEEIAHLSEPERKQLFDWLEELEEQAWDGQIERDFSPDGRGAHVVERIDREIDRTNAAGNVTSLLEGLRTRREQRAKERISPLIP
ncbi:MAG: hypothetical protein ACKV22_36795 [Bryobacteraceae bacterium]